MSDNEPRKAKPALKSGQYLMFSIEEWEEYKKILSAVDEAFELMWRHSKD